MIGVGDHRDGHLGRHSLLVRPWFLGLSCLVLLSFGCAHEPTKKTPSLAPASKGVPVKQKMSTPTPNTQQSVEEAMPLVPRNPEQDFNLRSPSLSPDDAIVPPLPVKPPAIGGSGG